MAGKKNPTFSFLVNALIQVEVRNMGPRPDMEEPDTKYQWEYKIIAAGTILFKGSDIYTLHYRNEAGESLDAAQYAAAKVLRLHMYPRVERNTLSRGQLNWFNVIAVPMQSIVEGIAYIGEYPGAQWILEDLTQVPFDENGRAVTETLDTTHVSEGTTQLAEAQMDVVDPENETAVTYPNLSTSPFSG